MSLGEREEGIGLRQEEERPRDWWRPLRAKRQLLTQGNEKTLGVWLFHRDP